MSKKKEFDSRQEDEKMEGYKTVKTELPSTRFQSEKQIVTSDQMGVTSRSKPDDAGNVADVAAKTLRSKIKLRPDVSVDDLGGKQVGGVPLAVETGLRNAAGAVTRSVVDDMSRTPYSSGKYRPDTRYGKKRSEDLFELDNAATEQVVPQVDDLPDLRKAPDKGVGYNGRQQFDVVRQKKNFYFTNADNNKIGKLPQQLLNDASVDFADIRQLVYTCGQVVETVASDGTVNTIPAHADYPTVNKDAAIATPMHKGNYIPEVLKLEIANGKITDVSISESYYHAPGGQVVRDQANTNWQIDANNVTKTMIKLQTELGRETSDKWSPLGYVINQPYEYNMLVHDIEATTGAIMAAAYRSAVSGLAYQRNIVKKDGIGMQKNGVKMIVEGYAGVLADNNDTTLTNINFNEAIFNKNAYRSGSAAALIDMFDSTTKYKTKADLLGMQRSFGLHLSQADNNINPLHCHSKFMKVLDKAHLFSTIDGSYNPFLPIFETKSIRLANPMSLNYFLQDWKNPATVTDSDIANGYSNLTGTKAIYSYSYKDQRNTYPTYVRHPIIEGLLYWLIKHEGSVAKTYGNGTVSIPFNFDMQCPCMISLLLCSAAQDVAFMRNIIFRDFLFAGEQSQYIWDDLSPLSELNPLYSSQLRIGKYDEPLTLGKIAPDTAVRLLYSDHMQVANKTDNKIEYYAPWYFNEEAFESNSSTHAGVWDIDSSWFNPDKPFNMSFPSIRDGVRHEYVDLIKSMDPEDIYLSLDRKVDLPMFNANPGNTSNHEFKPVFNTSAQNHKMAISTVRYDGNTDGRILVTYDFGNVNPVRHMPFQAMYCVPKEQGWIDWDYYPFNVITKMEVASGNDGQITLTTVTLDSTDVDAHNTNKYYYNGGLPFWITSYRVQGSDSDSTSTSILRSAALSQTFYRYFANSDGSTINEEFIKKTGLMFSRSYAQAVSRDIYGIYKLHTTNKATDSLSNTIISGTNFIWTTLQRWFLPVNVFANAFTEATITKSYDPMETCYWFGLCGFLAADYTQVVLERLSTIDQLGMDYTEDPNFAKSPIFR